MRGGLQFMTLSDVTSMLNHSSINLFKNDIEGFEYELIGGGFQQLATRLPGIRFLPRLHLSPNTVCPSPIVQG